MSFLDSQLKAVKVGNDASYLLEFFRPAADGTLPSEPGLAVESAHYHATIEATLPGGLEGGRYQIVIEGLTDADYAKIAPGNPERALVLKLYMYWGDAITGVGSFLKSLAGIGTMLSGDDKEMAMVAELQVLRVGRRVGELRYEATIDAAERVMYQLRYTPTPSHEPVKTLREAITILKDAAHIEVVTHPDAGPMTAPTAKSPGTERYEFEPGKSCAKSMAEIAKCIEDNRGKYGRGMLLIRRGVLHVGMRKIPLELARDPKELVPSGGLLSVQLDSSDAADPYAALAETPPPEGSTDRPKYTLTLKGRADLKPGDLVRFDLAELEMGKTTPSLVRDALLGPFSGAFASGDAMANPKIAYVEAVTHKMGRKQGYHTILKCVGTASASEGDVWDTRTAAAETGGETPTGPTSTDPAVRAALAVRRLSEATTFRRGLEVGEVRLHTANSAEEPTTQTEEVWCGLLGVDGRPNESRRLHIARSLPAVKSGIPYASPFAWGKCGLILPRYPGMRVAVGFRNGKASDAVDLGGIFETGQTSTNAQPGDWWLSLPAKVPAAQRGSIGPSESPSAYTDKVSQDLIDADGNRVIEVAEITIRVQEMNDLLNAGERPVRTVEPGTVTIEHAKEGARIVLKPDGTILLEGKNIQLVATEEIQLKANKVDVSVQSEMDVH